MHVLLSFAADLRCVFLCHQNCHCVVEEKKKKGLGALAQAENVTQAEVMATGNNLTPGLPKEKKKVLLMKSGDI